jgi:hypothetical protein
MSSACPDRERIADMAAGLQRAKFGKTQSDDFSAAMPSKRKSPVFSVISGSGHCGQRYCGARAASLALLFDSCTTVEDYNDCVVNAGYSSLPERAPLAARCRTDNRERQVRPEV